MSNRASPGSAPSLVQVVKQLSREWRSNVREQNGPATKESMNEYLGLPIFTLTDLIAKTLGYTDAEMQWLAWYSKILSAVSDYQRSGKSYKARCPAHEDNSPSLSISAANDGKVLLKCHAGCSTEAFVSALGLEMRDLFPSVDVDTTPRNSKKARLPSTAKGKSKTFPSAAAAVADLENRLGKRSALWTYHDAEGKPVGVIVRWDKPGGKDIRPVAKIGAGWIQSGMPTPRPLYRLPELWQSTGPVYLVEGEKAADALHALGFTVTTPIDVAGEEQPCPRFPRTGLHDRAIRPERCACRGMGSGTRGRVR